MKSNEETLPKEAVQNSPLTREMKILIMYKNNPMDDYFEDFEDNETYDVKLTKIVNDIEVYDTTEIFKILRHKGEYSSWTMTRKDRTRLSALYNKLR